MIEVTGRRGRTARWAALAALLATTAACTGSQPPPPTVRVDRGVVASTVSASGKLVAVTEQNLGFPDGGQLAEVLVRVGDRVEPGQVLARLDDFVAAQTLAQRRAQLAQQQAELGRVQDGNSVEAARASLEQSERILEATEAQVSATNRANDSATDRAKTQLEFDRSVLHRAEKKLREDKAACGNNRNSTPTPTAAPTPAPTTTPAPGQPQEDSSGTGSGGSSGGLIANPACDRIPADKAAVQDAERVVLSSETALDAAEQREKVDEASGRLSIENARQSVVSARNEVESAGSDRPADIESQQAQIRDAQAAVALAQRDVDEAVLRAPVAGVVSAINGAVGEFVGAASGATSLAPGSDAGLPGVSDVSGAGGSGGTGGAAPAGGGGFIVLNDVRSFQLIVPFEESDAARVAPNQAVEVAVDAVPGLDQPGTVLAVAPTGDEVSGIVNYNATILLNGGDPQLRDGQTAEASVVVDSAENVLRVPASVVRTEAGRTVVSSPGSEGPVTTPFEAGRMGDEFVEVRSGLSEGQEVLLPQAQVAPVAGAPN